MEPPPASRVVPAAVARFGVGLELFSGGSDGKLLRDKTIVVTGWASGIGRDTAKLIKQLGGDVIGVDRNKTEDYIDELYLADMSDRRPIKALVNALPARIDGIANSAGVPTTLPADIVLKVNLVGLKYFTELMIPKLSLLAQGVTAICTGINDHQKFSEEFCKEMSNLTGH